MDLKIALISLALSFTIFGEFAYAGDVKGSQDHPLISRFPGTSIVGHKTSNYKVFYIATGPMTHDAISTQGKTALPPVSEYEGKATSITYRADNKETSALEIFRNFERAFNENGFNKVYSCSNTAECGPRFVSQLYWYGDPSRPGLNPTLDAPNRHTKRHTYHYWSGTAQVKQQTYVISLLVAQHTNQSFPAVIALDINVPTQLNDKQIKISLDFLDKSFNNKGKATLEGILFDFDKASIKPESKEALTVIGDFIQQRPQENFYIVGHTDNEGTTQYNLNLSQARADAVMKYLVTTFNIDRTRLSAFGVGPYSPEARNDSDKNRALNRRVELVANQK